MAIPSTGGVSKVTWFDRKLEHNAYLWGKEPQKMPPKDLARKAMWEAYGFVAAFREAAEKLKAGDRSVAFPAGSFPPGLPFVRA